jgi:hypothetical protein
LITERTVLPLPDSSKTLTESVLLRVAASPLQVTGPFDSLTLIVSPFSERIAEPLSEKIWTKRMSDSGSYSQVVAAAASDGKRAPAAQQTAAAQDSVNTREATPLSIPVPIHPCLQSIRTPASCGKPT